MLIRTDHLQAMIHYCLEQAHSSQVSVLDCGDNENHLNLELQVKTLEQMKTALYDLIEYNDHRHCTLKVLREMNSDLILERFIMSEVVVKDTTAKMLLEEFHDHDIYEYTESELQERLDEIKEKYDITD